MPDGPCRSKVTLSSINFDRVKVDRTAFCERDPHDINQLRHEAMVRMPKHGDVGPPRWFRVWWGGSPKDYSGASDLGSAPDSSTTRPVYSETPHSIPENDLVDGPNKL